MMGLALFFLRHPRRRCQLCPWRGRRQRAYQRHHARCHAVRFGIRLPGTDPDIPAVPPETTILTWPLSIRAQQATPLPRRYT